MIFLEGFVTSKWPMMELIEFVNLLGNLWNKQVKKLGNNATRLRLNKKYEEAIDELLKINGLKNMHGKNEAKLPARSGETNLAACASPHYQMILLAFKVASGFVRCV